MYALRVTVASMCAAFIGATLSLYYLPTGFWWVGAIAGGALGWVGYDTKVFRQNAGSAIVSVWRETTRKLQRKPKPVYPVWAKRATQWERLGMALLLSSVASAASLLFGFTHNFAPGVEVPWTIIQTLELYPIGAGLSIPLAVLLSPLMANNIALNEWYGESAAIKSIAEWKKAALLINPIVAPFALVYAVFFIAIPRVVIAIPWVVKFTARVCVKTYEFTTSNGRIATLIGGSMGAFAGYFLGNPVTGALVGGGVGLTLALMRSHGARVRS